MNKNLYTTLHTLGIILLPVKAGNSIPNGNSNRGQHSVLYKITVEKCDLLGVNFLYNFEPQMTVIASIVCLSLLLPINLSG